MSVWVVLAPLALVGATSVGFVAGLVMGLAASDLNEDRA